MQDPMTEFDFGYEHASALLFEHGTIEIIEQPYPIIDDDKLDEMWEYGIKQLNADQYWEGFNLRAVQHVGK